MEPGRTCILIFTGVVTLYLSKLRALIHSFTYQCLQRIHQRPGCILGTADVRGATADTALPGLSTGQLTLVSCSVMSYSLWPPWTVAHQAPLSMEFSRQQYWSGLSFPSPGDLLDSGIEPGSPALQADSLPSEPPSGGDRQMPSSYYMVQGVLMTGLRSGSCGSPWVQGHIKAFGSISTKSFVFMGPFLHKKCLKWYFTTALV